MTACPRCGEESGSNARFCPSCGSALSDASETRKTVTILFSDIAGSTAMGEQTDPESMRWALMGCFSEIRAIIQSHGGTVEKFIGDAVMAVFGVPVVHEDDALRAVRAAIEIWRRMGEMGEDLRRERGIALSWRTGINTGEVVAGDPGAGQSFVTGDAVNLAARLEQAATPGEILLGEGTHQLVRSHVDLEGPLSLTLKGKSAPVLAYRLSNADTPSPVRTARLDAPLIGRSGPRADLEAVFRAALEGPEGRMFTVVGAAGIGKSRLVADFSATVAAQATVARGRCLCYGSGITYAPIGEVVRQLASVSDGDGDDVVRARLAARLAGERDIGRKVERLGELLGRFNAEGSPDDTSWAFASLINAEARRRPVVLVIDDIHWAELTLLELLGSVLARADDWPVVLICLARPELLEVHPNWGAGGRASIVSLEPLGTAETRQLVQSMLGQADLPSDLVERITEAAQGNPLFVHEMLAVLIDRGQLVRQGDSWVVTADRAEVVVPPTIQALLAARIDGLDARERAVVGGAAVEGQDFHLAAVRELVSPELRTEVDEAIASLVRKQMISYDEDTSSPHDSDGALLSFSHLLVRDAAYAALPKQTRSRLHESFATWLIGTDAYAGEQDELLGHHYSQAHSYRRELGMADEQTSRLSRRAAIHLAAAGRRALDRLDVRAAIKLLSAAVELSSPDLDEHVGYLADLAWVTIEAGDFRAAQTLAAESVEQAAAHRNELDLARSHLVQLAAHHALGTVSLKQVIRETGKLLPIFELEADVANGERAALLAAKNHLWSGRAELARQILQRVADSARARGRLPGEVMVWLFSAMHFGPTPVPETIDRLGAIGELFTLAAEAGRLSILGSCLGLIGNYTAARESIARSVVLFREAGTEAMAEVTMGQYLGPIETAAGNLDVAESITLDSYYATSARGDTGLSSTTAAYLALVYVAKGRWADAGNYARIAVETADADDVESHVRGGSALARSLAASGEITEAISLSARCVEMAERTDFLEIRGESNRHRAEVLLVARKAEEAEAAFRAALDNFEPKGMAVESDRVRRRLADMALSR